MKIGILTITPNVGFGGIMQAYALKYTLEKMGHKVRVINYTKKYTITEKIRFFTKACLKKISGHYVKFSFESDYNYRSQNVSSFIKNHLDMTNKVSNTKDLQYLINNNFDAVVVGSDQVWRPKYVLGIKNYFLDGINKEIRKLAYAASLGVNSWEYSKDDTAACAKLIKNFHYVSVRESNARMLIADNLSYEGSVYCDLDPTLLAGKEAYLKFVQKKQTTRNIFTYILDKTNEKCNVIKNVAREIGYTINEFNTKAEDCNAPLCMRIAPPVEEWLNGLYNSDFVVTDSFHGCVFSILFNKPFIVYGNRQRGLDRFTSILDFLDLSDTLICSEGDFNKKLIEKSFNWVEINNKLESQRNEIIKRLKIVLNN